MSVFAGHCLGLSPSLPASQVTVHNELPADWPQVTEGITIHWHGFDMRGAEYYDGVAFLQQCPIAPRHQLHLPLHGAAAASLTAHGATLVHGSQQCTVRSPPWGQQGVLHAGAGFSAGG